MGSLVNLGPVHLWTSEELLWGASYLVVFLECALAFTLWLGSKVRS